jgi:predicted alpha/beta superfamily hydrolase
LRVTAQRAAKWVVLPTGIACLAFTLLCVSIWQRRVELTVHSKALGDVRRVSVFNSRDNSPSHETQIVSLDGQTYRNGVIAAATATLVSLIRWQSVPIVIAVHDMGKRDIDMRPKSVQPAYWRPNISGRSAQFDIFVTKELAGEVEQRFGVPTKTFLMGHSLGGFYALDLASRSPRAFDGFLAYSPTFSHDLSLLNRLGVACSRAQFIYFNIGLESRRDDAIFERVASLKACESRSVNIERHFGMIHAVVMLTGQASGFLQAL